MFSLLPYTESILKSPAGQIIYCHISIKSPYNQIFLRTGTKWGQTKGAKTTFYIFKYSIFYKTKKPILFDRL